MKSKMKVVKKSSKPKARRSKPKAQVMQTVAYDAEFNYERALARSIMDHGAMNVGEDAVTLAAAVSSLTSSMKKLSYNYGLNVGRSVYKIFEAKRHYKWYGESIQDIVLFFEKLGYGYILYNILTEGVEISIHRKNKTSLGCNIHSFDSGVIAGFLGAARGDFVRVAEVSCCNNGAQCCKFATGITVADPFSTNIDGILNMLKADPSEGMVRPEYQMLISEPLMRAEYSGQISTIFAHLGRQIAANWGDKMSAAVLDGSAKAMERFGLGRLEGSARPLKLEIRLDGVKAKKEFVDISISFLNGMIGRYFSKPLKSQLTKGEKGSYRIIVKQ
jgi:predicted hydrocarbon binding protein